MPTYLPTGVRDELDALKFSNQSSQDIAALDWEQRSLDDISTFGADLKLPSIASATTTPTQAFSTPDSPVFEAPTPTPLTTPRRQPQPTPEAMPTLQTPTSSAQDTSSDDLSSTPAQTVSVSSAPVGGTAPAGAPSPSSTPAAMPAGGSNLSLEAYTRQKAASLGIDPDTAVRVANTEGGLGDPTRQNTGGAPAYGPYQLYIGGPSQPGLGDEALRQGIDPRNPSHVYRSIDFALEHAARNGWGAFQGAAAHGIGNFEGIGTGRAGQTPSPPEVSTTRQPAPSAPSEDIAQVALDDPDKWSLCGPVAAIIAATNRGGNWTIAQAKKLAVANNLWDSDTGMHGLATEVQLLKQMGISAATGAADLSKLASDAIAGNTPIISTIKHYFILKGYDPETQRFDTSTSGTALKGGSRWLTLDQIAKLGGGIQGAAYLDNPSSPISSVATQDAAGPPSPAAAPAASTSQPDPPQAALAEGSTMYRQPLGQPAPVPMPGSVDDQATGANRLYSPPADSVPDRGWIDRAVQQPDDRLPGYQRGDVTDAEGLDRTNDELYPVPGPAPGNLGTAPIDSGVMYRQPLGAPTAGPDASTGTPSPGTAAPIRNPDGSVTTERSITVTDPRLNGGRPTNIPTVWGGTIVSDDQAIENASRSGMQWPSFNSIKQAEQAARQRSNDLGTGQATSVGGATVPWSTVDPTAPNLSPDVVNATTDVNRSLIDNLVTPPTSYRQPLGPTAGPDTFPTDASGSGVGASGSGPEASPYPASQAIPNEDATSYPRPAYVPPAEPLVTAPDSATERQLAPPEPPASPLKPLYDLAGNIKGYVDEGVQTAQNAAQQAAPIASRAINAAPLPHPLQGIATVAGLADETIQSSRQQITRWQELNNKAMAARLQGGPPLTPDEEAEYADLNTAVAAGTLAGPAEGHFTAPDASAVAPITERIGNAVQDIRGRLAAGSERAAATEAERAASGTAGQPAYGVIGPVPNPSEEVRIPRAGYAQDISPGAEDMVRAVSEANAPAETVRRADVAQKAQDILGVSPEQAQAWQDAALSEAPDARAVRGEALRQAEYIDAENANRAIERLQAAQARARAAGGAENLAADDKYSVADAILEAADAARAFGRSATASTAEGRATARALGQRRNAITARQAFEAAARARLVGQDAAFAANEVQRAARTGTLSPAAEQRLRTLREKLANPEAHGLGMTDGANGRLDALEQAASSTTAAVTAGPVANAGGPPRLRLRSQAQPQRVGVGFGTRIATDVGNAALGSIVGGTAGYVAPANTDEERIRNARIGAVAGGIGYPVVGRLMGRGRGVLGAFGPAPLPGEAQRGVGAVTEAFGAQPGERVQMRFRVVPLEDLITSHTDRLAVNPSFPPELQPRIRERVASQAQINKIIAEFDPGQMLVDTHTIDRGPMIVGSDGVVESGNGRSIALRRLAAEQPEKYQRYLEELRGSLKEYGLSPADLEGVKTPVLVRERTSDLDRAAFTGAANVEASARMAPIEEALQDVQRLPDGLIARLAVNEDQTINAALLSPANQDLVRAFVGGLPASQQGSVLGARGDLNASGLERLKSALLAKTYTGEAGARISTAFVEGTDSGIRNIENAVYASLPSMARAEASIATGAREAGMSVAPDVAAAVDVFARLKRAGMSVPDYLQQAGMFGDRETTPFQDQLLQFFNDNARSPRRIRAMLEEYANALDSGGMFGAPANATKEEVLSDALRALGPAEAAAGTDLGRVGAGSDELARAPQGPAATPEPSTSAAPLPAAEESLQRFQAARAAPEALTGPRTPASDIIPAGGPEGSLAIAGAPQPVARPGAIPDQAIPPTGGSPGRLNIEGAPPRPASLPPAEGIPSTGGPAGTLRAEGAPPSPANLAPVGPNAAPVGGPAGTLQAPPLASVAEQRAIQQARIRGVVSQIDAVLSNPTAPEAVARLQQLHADLQEISKAGFERSSEIRQRLYRQNLLKAGLSKETGDLDSLVNALADVDPNDPSSIRPVLYAVQRPSLWGMLREMQYVNMLSSPVTHAVNASANGLQIAGRLLLNNPLEFIGSGGTSTGTGAAFVGTARGAAQGWQQAKTIMRTGVNPDAVERAIETGAIGQMGRELLTEKFGKLGAAMHVVSTRPLEAMDALLGHMAYAGAAEQYAQRTADRLLTNNAAAVKGMSREQARAHVMSNIWDYPDVIEKAGKIQDYTLLKSRDVEGGGWARMERALRWAAGLRNLPENPGAADYVISGVADFIAPFFNVPLNFAKQGAERSVGAPINLGRAAIAASNGDRERAGELFAKGMIGAATMGSAGALAAGDNLTADGPTDPSQRMVWLEDHQPNSWRIPGTQQWFTYQGTPWAIPFATVAGAKESYQEANAAASKKGLSNPEVAVATGVGTYRGAVQGFLSQSFMQGIASQYQFLTGQDTGLGAASANISSAASRYTPVLGSSLLNFLARVTDGMERDAGKPLALGDVAGNVATRLEQRIPGLRQQTNTRLGAYGEDVPNQQSGLAGLVPYYRGPAPRPGDAITQRLEEAQVGTPLAPTAMPVPNMPPGQSIQIPLTMEDRRVYQQAAGQKFREILEKTGAQDARKFPPAALEQMRADARQYAEAQVARAVGTEEMTRRVREAVATRRKAS